MDSGNGRSGAPAVGGLVVLVFGLIFVEADLSGLSSGVQTTVRIVALIVALALFSVINRARRAAGATRGEFGRQYWTIVAVEVVALLAGIVVINSVFGAHELTVPWIAVVVGVHFFAFIRLWGSRVYLVLGVVVTLLGVAGFVVYALGGSLLTIRLVSGICSGIVLYLAAANSLLRMRGAGAQPQAVDG